MKFYMPPFLRIDYLVITIRAVAAVFSVDSLAK